MSNPLSDYWLERYALDELPQAKREEIRILLQADPGLQQRLRELTQSNDAILRHYPATAMADRIRERQLGGTTADRTVPNTHVTWARPGWMFPAGTVAVAAALALWIMPAWLLPQLHPGAGLEITRLKGMESGLTIYRQHQGNAELLKPFAFARHGDLLQIAYVSLTEPYGVIISIDGRGTATLHFPENNQTASKLQIKHKTLLPKAYELDNAPGFERFFLITSVTPISPLDILRAARTLAQTPHLAKTESLPLNRNLHQYSVVIQKSERQ
jgi:hypothetical protein